MICKRNTVSGLNSTEIEAGFFGHIHLICRDIRQISPRSLRFGEGLVGLMEPCHKSDGQTDG